MTRPLKIACVHTLRNLSGEVLGAMNVIRFIRISEALSRQGHEVHFIANGAHKPLPVHPSVRRVSPTEVRWEDYDVVKTCLHSGFQTLTAWNGDDHPFIVANLGSVVASEDIDGVYFYRKVREDLWATQQRVAARSRFVSLMSKENAALFHRMHGDRDGMLYVPGAADTHVPEPGANPYHAIGITQPVALFAGNIYARDRQGEVNQFWQQRLNQLGQALQQRGIQLVAMGLGNCDEIDRTVVRHVGVVDFRDVWNWQWHAHVGVVLAQGARQDNESTKIYYYLRTGLPVVCESSVPNAWLISETGHGMVVDYTDDEIRGLANATLELVRQPPDASDVIPYIVQKHSWDARAAVYSDALVAAWQPRMSAQV